MLQVLRHFAASIFAKILFALLLCAFGMWGIGDFLRQQPTENAVIKAGGGSISGDELRRDVQERIEAMHGQITLEQARMFGLVDQVIDSDVAKLLLDAEAQHQHIYVGDQQIVDEIAADKNFQTADGHFDRVAFLNALAAHNMTEAKYESMLRTGLPRELAVSPALDGDAAPKFLADLLYRGSHEQRVADWVLLPVADIKDIPAPDQAALQAYYDKHHDAFTSPEYRGFTALALVPAAVDAGISLTDKQLQDGYQQRLDEYTKLEKRHVLQMLLPDEKTANDAAQQLQAGKDFTEIAKTLGKQDASTIDLGTIAKSDLPPQTADAAFAAPEKAPTKPIKTPFGWTIVEVTGIEPGGVKSFDEVKPALETEMRKEAEQNALYELSNKVEDAVSAGGDIAQIAKQFNLTSLTQPAIDRDGNAPDGKPIADTGLPVQQLTASLFETASGQLSSMQEIPDNGGFFVVRTDTVTQPALKPFDQVKDQVSAAWLADQKADKVAEQAKALADAVKPDMPLAKLAAAKHLKLTTTAPFVRQNPGNQPQIPPLLVSRLFTLKAGEATSVPVAAGQYVAQLTAIKPADPATDNAGMEQQSAQLSRQFSDELIEQLVGALKQTTSVDIRRADIDKLFPAGRE